MINGVINVYKEAGFTSHDVVAKLRGIAGQRKIGHTGTLDPDAVGVLPVCLGNATKLCDMLTDETKEYEACLQLGITTDTQDLSGSILSEKKVEVTEEAFRQAALSFVGEYDQIPPMYSALKVNGKKLYELAREGKTVERRARRVQIFSLEILEVKIPFATMRVTCSKGTYIRTLCQDIGEKLGCGGAMKSLKRTRVGCFTLEKACTLAVLQDKKDAGELMDVVTPVDRLFEQYRKCCVLESGIRLVQNGNSLPVRLLGEKVESLEDREQIRLYDHKGRFYGIFQAERKSGLVKPVKMFLEREE
ncbi:MAG: tRNA pseudouridine(55) synthase TruB [Lachnospiraceae bacterium]|nr:tRNA pseudouridine(55) synthase TruB [Lachnospiraceae bacterium]